MGAEWGLKLMGKQEISLGHIKGLGRVTPCPLVVQFGC
jgi:hypothetical protein